MVCLCLCILFLPPHILSLPFLFMCSIFNPPPLPPSTTFFSAPPPFPSLTPLSSGSAGVHMIKHGTQVITWRCQIKRPLIQMRSEISKSSVALAATTHPRRRRRGDLRARGPAGRQQQHPAFPRYKISPVESTEPNMPGFTGAYLFVSHSLLVR